jgi:hypothetical protein
MIVKKSNLKIILIIKSLNNFAAFSLNDSFDTM